MVKNIVPGSVVKFDDSNIKLMLMPALAPFASVGHVSRVEPDWAYIVVSVKHEPLVAGQNKTLFYLLGSMSIGWVETHDDDGSIMNVA